MEDNLIELCMRQQEICFRAFMTYGAKVQIGIAMEECAEFIVAASHFLRERPGAMEEFVEELADVQICLTQMEIMLAQMGQREKFVEMFERKLSRLEKRISERE